MEPVPPQRDTNAWVFQAWASFVISFAATLIGIVWLPVDHWVRAFLVMGLLFTVNACFTLAKTVRDNHEADKFINRLSGAKAEKLLQEFEGRSALGQ
jgi:hypothetical protein